MRSGAVRFARGTMGGGVVGVAPAGGRGGLRAEEVSGVGAPAAARAGLDSSDEEAWSGPARGRLLRTVPDRGGSGFRVARPGVGAAMSAVSPDGTSRPGAIVITPIPATTPSANAAARAATCFPDAM